MRSRMLDSYLHHIAVGFGAAVGAELLRGKVAQPGISPLRILKGRGAVTQIV